MSLDACGLEPAVQADLTAMSIEGTPVSQEKQTGVKQRRVLSVCTSRSMDRGVVPGG